MAIWYELDKWWGPLFVLFIGSGDEIRMIGFQPLDLWNWEFWTVVAMCFFIPFFKSGHLVVIKVKILVTDKIK